MMNSLVWTFSKPSPNGTIASNRLATWLGEVIKAPVVWNDSALKYGELDVLFIVDGAFAFCGHLPTLAKLVLRAKRIIWCQIDYTVVQPKSSSNGASPFRAAFRRRKENGLPEMDTWTTVMEMKDKTPLSSYLNWNRLPYEPVEPALRKHRTSEPTLLYYGAGRQGRWEYFKRYFTNPAVKVVISNATDKFKEFEGKNVKLIPSIPREQFYTELASAGMGLFLEDRRSHGGNHSPPTRFYEMLAAGLPMVFQPEAVAGMARAGFDVKEFALPEYDYLKPDLSQKKLNAVLKGFMKEREHMAHAQQRLWGRRDYREELRQDVLKLWRGYKRRAF